MAESGHNVHIICHKSKTDSANLPDLHNLFLHRIDPEVNPVHGLFPAITDQVSYAIGMIAEGRKIIRNDKIDIIHANTLNPAVAGAVLGIFHRIPVVSTVHHIHSVQSNSRVYKMLQMQNASPVNVALGRITRTIYEKIIIKLPVEYIHSVSNTTCHDLRRFGYKGKIRVIPNGLHLGRFDNGCSIDYKPYLLFIGRLVDYKNLDVVIEAFAETTKVLPRARLVIVGDGPMRQRWTEKAAALGIRTSVHFRGYVSEEEKVKLLSKCSGLVFPSLVEGFGMVVLEAFALSKPVLASDIDSLHELVEDGIDGFLIEPSSVQGWTDKMSGILNSPSTSRAMGCRGRIRVERYYSMDRVGGMLESLYQNIISKNRTTVGKELVAT